jgi:predicted Fe-Mo cluster-binding NifX family protein
MLIAIATNDRENIALRTGRAKEFAIFSIENKTIIAIDYQENDHQHHEHNKHEGGHNHNHDEVVAQLKNVNVFLVHKVGKHMKKDLEKGNIPYQLVNGTNIEEIIASYINEA